MFLCITKNSVFPSRENKNIIECLLLVGIFLRSLQVWTQLIHVRMSSHIGELDVSEARGSETTFPRGFK